MTRRTLLQLGLLLLPVRVSAAPPWVGLHPARRAYLHQIGVRYGEIVMIERYGGWSRRERELRRTR